MFDELPIRSPLNDAPIYFKAEVTSTMDEAAALADAGAGAGTAVLADFQSQGRGRRQAGVWEAAPGENLLFTVLLEKKYEPGAPLTVPLLIGLAVIQALAALYGLEAGLRWPNDVLAGGKKLAGILCQVRGGFVLAGIGINCNQRRFPPELEGRAASLIRLLGREVDRRELLLAVLEAIRDVYGATAWRSAIEARLIGKGERRRLLVGEGAAAVTMSGVVKGVGESGELLLRLDGDNQIKGFFSGSLIG